MRPRSLALTLARSDRRSSALDKSIIRGQIPPSRLGKTIGINYLEDEQKRVSAHFSKLKEMWVYSKVRRQRMNDNLLGDVRFCPNVRRTKRLRDFEAADLTQRCKQIVASYLYHSRPLRDDAALGVARADQWSQKTLSDPRPRPHFKCFDAVGVSPHLPGASVFGLETVSTPLPRPPSPWENRSVARPSVLGFCRASSPLFAGCY